MIDLTRRRALKVLGIAGLLGVGVGSGSAKNEQRVFVHPDSDSSQVEQALRDHGGAVRFSYDNFDFVAGNIPPKKRRDLKDDNRVARLEDDQQVQLIEPVHHKPGHDRGGGGNGGGGDDDGCSDHPNQIVPWGVERIGANSVSEDGSGVSVGIIDTGVESDHCDLRANVVGGHNCTGTGPSNKFDDKDGHGTHVSGIVGAESNGIGVRGVAENPDLYGLKVFDNSGFAAWSYVVCAIDWCVSNGIEIMNLSLGGPENSSVGDAINTAYTEGHLIVAAAGNADDDGDKNCDDDVKFPASHPNAISVSAMEGKNGEDALAEYSSTGDAPDDYELDDNDTANDIDIMAPGGGDDNEDGDYTTDELVKSTWTDDSYAWTAGTSMASPHVAGVAALAWQKLGSDGPGSSDRDDIESALFSTADPIEGDACLEGAGLVDASETVSNA